MEITRLSIRAFCAFIIAMAGFAAAATLTVDDDPGQPYTSIQDALDDASAGDVVYVYPGLYNEGLTVPPGVSLLGADPRTTILDGGGAIQHVVTLQGGEDPARISGFRIRNSAPGGAGGSWHYGGVYCQSGPVLVQNNIIEDNHAGVSVLAAARPSIINNTIVDNLNGVIFQAAPSGYTLPEVDVAYIWRTNKAAAGAFAALLEDIGLSMEAIPAQETDGVDFAEFRLVVIGPDTGSGYDWLPAPGAAAIAESGVPVLGLGRGGAAFFSQIGSPLGWGNTWMGPGTTLFAANRDHNVFNQPNDIPIPKSGLLQLYTTSDELLELYAPELPRGAQLIGRNPTDENHFSLVKYTRYSFWGFQKGVQNLTAVGWDVMTNTIRDLITRCYQLPQPQLTFLGTEPTGTPGRLYYNLGVANWYSYPAELFETSPDLPPCGANPNSSRTWVEIYTEDNQFLNRFCAFGDPTDLRKPWFAWDADEVPPVVKIVLNDRRCGLTYESEPLDLSLVTEPIWPYTVMNNIIAHNAQTGIFFYNYVGAGRILYNDVWSNGSTNYFNNSLPGAFAPFPGTGEISADPLFVDVADFFLDDGSPARDAGNPAAIWNDPDDTRNDMGVWGGPESSGLGDHPGSGFVFTTVGNLPTADIEQNVADPSHGLAVGSGYHDAPFGASLHIRGLFGGADIAAGVRYYQILAARWPNDSTPPAAVDFQPLTDSLHKVRYTILPGGAVHAEKIQIGPKEVYGVQNLYELTHDGYWSNLDLRIIWNTRGVPNGKYTLRVKAYRNHPMIIFALQEYPLAQNDLSELDLVVNNTPVTATINSVKYDPSSPAYTPGNDGLIDECAIISLATDTENLRFNVTAWHPDGYLRHWVLDALYGKNQYAGVIASQTYPGTTPPDDWHGVMNTEFDSEDAPSLDPWHYCAYQFRLRAYTRATNGYGYLYSTAYGYSREFSDHYFIQFLCSWCEGADIDRSGFVDMGDLARLAAKWLQTCSAVCEE